MLAVSERRRQKMSKCPDDENDTVFVVGSMAGMLIVKI
jgi:hypothetical protein